MKNKRSKVIHSLNDCSLNDGRMVAIENSESAVVYCLNENNHKWFQRIFDNLDEAKTFCNSVKLQDNFKGKILVYSNFSIFTFGEVV